MNFLREIRERRVLPALGVYVGACWVVVEILDRLTDRYFLSPYLTDIVFWGLYSLLPTVFLLAWTHGRPGKDRATRAEKIGIPLNLIASISLVLMVFGSKDLSATAELVTVANELGQNESHYVPRDSYRRRLAVFFFANDSGDPALDWLQYGVTDLLAQDLRQNPFIVVTSPWPHYGFSSYGRMQAAGYDDGLDLPLSLKQDIAHAANRAYFIDGGLDRVGDQFRVTANIWDTDSIERLAELTEQGNDLLAVVDRISTGIREVLETPSAGGGAGDLPLRETYGPSVAAIKSYVEARNALMFANDFAESNRLYDKAIEADPGFVLAWLRKGLNQWEQGDAGGAEASLTAAQKLAYRLPERNRTELKGMTYRISGDQEKLEKFLRLQVRIRDDAVTYRDLASFLALTGRLEEAKQHFKTAMQRDSSDLRSYMRLAVLERSTGNVDAAIDYVARFLEVRPGDLEGHLMMGDLWLHAGDMEVAGDYFEQAQLLDDPPVTATLRLTGLAMRQADWAEARELIEQARSAAVTPQQLSAVLNAESDLEVRLGRIQRALELVEKRAEINRQVMSPVEQIFSYNIPVIQFNLLLDRTEVAEEVLTAARGAIQPPINQFLSFMEALLRARTGEWELAELAVEEGRGAIERFKADYLSFQIPLASAEIAAAREDYSAAASLYQEAIERLQRSAVAIMQEPAMGTLYGVCTEMHVRAGELDAAQAVLEYGFKRDTAEPLLWVGQAMLQDANGARHMALASVNYALAIWADADPEYVKYREVLALRDRLAATLP
jgi:tetratricopeptide (TPR) repeat protein